MQDALIVLGGYLLGSIPFGYLIPRLVRRDDVRRHGSGNVGASNVWRVYGRSLGIPVALLDVAKGFVPALVGLELGGDWVGVLAGAAAMVGHARPVFLGFSKGGKMVATAGGVAFALAPFAALACLVVWALTFAAFRYASLASMVTAGALPLLCLAFGSSWPVVGFTALAAVGVLALHRNNVRRLLAGTEPKFSRALPESSGDPLRPFSRSPGVPRSPAPDGRAAPRAAPRRPPRTCRSGCEPRRPPAGSSPAGAAAALDARPPAPCRCGSRVGSGALRQALNVRRRRARLRATSGGPAGGHRRALPGSLRPCPTAPRRRRGRGSSPG